MVANVHLHVGYTNIREAQHQGRIMGKARQIIARKDKERYDCAVHLHGGLVVRTVDAESWFMLGNKGSLPGPAAVLLGLSY
jgi:hypothetical protein